MRRCWRFVCCSANWWKSLPDESHFSQKYPELSASLGLFLKVTRYTLFFNNLTQFSEVSWAYRGVWDRLWSQSQRAGREVQPTRLKQDVGEGGWGHAVMLLCRVTPCLRTSPVTNTWTPAVGFNRHFLLLCLLQGHHTSHHLKLHRNH